MPEAEGDLPPPAASSPVRPGWREVMINFTCQLGWDVRRPGYTLLLGVSVRRVQARSAFETWSERGRGPPPRSLGPPIPQGPEWRERDGFTPCPTDELTPASLGPVPLALRCSARPSPAPLATAQPHSWLSEPSPRADLVRSLSLGAEWYLALTLALRAERGRSPCLALHVTRDSGYRSTK